MRYVVFTVAVLLAIGLVTGAAPIEVMITWSVVIILAVAAFGGARRNNRIQALRRTLFFNESLISYRESVTDHPRGDPLNPGL